MKSGTMLTGQLVVLFNKPPALQLAATSAKRPGGTVKPELGVARAVCVPTPGVPITGPPAIPLPFEGNAVCDDSTDTPNQATLPTSCTNRIAGWRAQLK